MVRRIFAVYVLVMLWCAAAPAMQSDSARSQAYYHFLMGAMKERSRDFPAAIQEYKEALKYDPKSAEIFSHLAELYIQTNRIEEAIQDAGKALEKNPDNKEAHRMLGQIYLEKMYMSESDRQDLLSAIHEFQEVRRIDPSDDTASLSLGQLYLQNNQPQDAIRILTEYVSKNPDAPTAVLALASAYQQINQNDQAISYLSQYLEMNPDNVNAVLQIADLYEKRGDYSHALEFLKQAYESDRDNFNLVRKYADLLGKAQEYSEAVRILEERRKAEPTRHEWSVLLARTLQKSGSQDQAEAVLREEIQKTPEDLDLRLALVQVYEDGDKYQDATRELDAMMASVDADRTMEEKERRANLALIYTHKGFVAQQVKDYEGSIQFYRQARDLVEEEDKGKIDFYIALNYHRLKKWDLAIQTIDSVLQKDPNDADAWELLAMIYEDKGDIENSDKVVQHLIETHPDAPYYYLLKAEKFQQREKYEESIEYLKGLVKKFPSSDQIYFLLGAANERLKKIDEAEENFRQAITLNQRNANALNYLGYMLIEKGVRLEESVGYVKRALEIDRDNGAYLDSLGWGYFKLNKMDLAEDHLRMALERLDDNAVVHDHMGDLYFKQGRFSDAISHWEKALEKDGKDIDPEFIRKKIHDTKSRLP